MPDDIARLRDEYKNRQHRFADSDVYSVFNKANLFGIHQRQWMTLNFLRQTGISELSNARVLEMGCGNGGVLTEYLGFGAAPENLYGVDLLFDRLHYARKHLPGSNFANANGSHLPFSAHSFDIVIQYTAISSILDLDLRREICSEMLRALKPNGVILSYDFWLNPTNKQTLGLGLKEIRDCFPGCHIDYKKITLAPPIARNLVPFSSLLSAFLEKITIFNTHYLIVIRPNSV